ncbi:MAG: alanine--tRNA ligase, partial [Acidimicrobiales bacterium]
MDANELRQAFTGFFAARDHQVVPSASLIPHDATLLSTNAGMVPFKAYFLGEEEPPHKRATTVQKCVRAGGKHNDLDEVGRTSRHLTFFEMMGNFSFGDYFKSEAIPMAWEFFTDVLDLDPDRLWVTVHLTDDEAAKIWHDDVGVPLDRIQRLDEDNWWRMADTGPNGPCSEIFWDKGPEYGPDGGPANPEADERFVEIWNLVFMEFDQQPDGEQVPLPEPSIDTGAGLERLLSVLQGVDAVWGTDEFVELLSGVAEIVGVDLESELDPKTAVSMQILADHARSTTFLVNDGVFPSNEDRGYVLRRIVRRAVRHAYLLGVEEPVMARLVSLVVGIMGQAYPELVENQGFIADVLKREEESFRRTLESGSNILDGHLAELASGETLDGGIAFQLHDTYGFPLELTEEITSEMGVSVDVAGFNDAMGDQRSRARADFDSKGAGQADLKSFQEVLATNGPTEFVGRESSESQAVVLLVTEDSIVLDKTPFYAESGGQVGDTGTIMTATGTAAIVDTTYGAAGVHRHVVGDIEGIIEAGQSAYAAIDRGRRAAIMRNHTATHLLHAALREVLGDHVKQQGSWVGPDRLRFDFSHYEPLTADQIEGIEDMVNGDVLSNVGTDHFETHIDEARKLGAIAFFGDKYGDVVRVLRAGPNSIELCGGTHVDALGDIGLVKIVSEGSIGSNLRRVEAVSGDATMGLLRASEKQVEAAADLVGVPVEGLIDGILKRKADLDELELEVQRLRSAAAAGRSGELARDAVGGVVVARVDGVSRDDLKELAQAVKHHDEVDVVVLGSALSGGGAALV